MKHLLSTLLLVVAGAIPSTAATIVFDNLNSGGDGAYGVRDAGGALVSGSEFVGVLGRFTISNTTISNSFSAGNLAAIQSGFQQFDPVSGTFVLDNFVPGVFQASESFDTKASSNAFGGSAIYAVFYRGSSIATASELFIAQMSSAFPTDPEVGAGLNANLSLRPDTIANLVVGNAGLTPHDFGLGSGPLSTFGLEAIPEPSRVVLLGLAGVLTLFRRRRLA